MWKFWNIKTSPQPRSKHLKVEINFFLPRFGCLFCSRLLF
jgi:hypothetical protein